jgi:hypothetical protein
MPLPEQGAVTTVTTSLTTLITLDSYEPEIIGFQIENGATALNACVLEARVSSDTNNWVELPISTSASAPWPAFSTTDLTSLTSSAKAILAVAGQHWYQVRLRASVASSTSNVTVYFTKR